MKNLAWLALVSLLPSCASSTGGSAEACNGASGDRDCVVVLRVVEGAGAGAVTWVAEDAGGDRICGSGGETWVVSGDFGGDCTLVATADEGGGGSGCGSGGKTLVIRLDGDGVCRLTAAAGEGGGSSGCGGGNSPSRTIAELCANCLCDQHLALARKRR